MFEIGGTYANRIGKYRVVEIDEPRMTVEYEDGSTAELNINIQLRIWENILAEEEIRHSRMTRSRERGNKGTKHFIRPVSSLVAEQLALRGYKEHVLASLLPGLNINQGDRLIYFAIEGQVYFAVVTITGPPTEPTAKDHLTERQAGETVLLFPVDIDTRATGVDNAVPFDAVEVESQPDIKNLLKEEDTYILITEDEFELLAELLTEATEDAAEDEDDQDEDEEEDYED